MADIIELRNIKKMVKGILEAEPSARNSDDFLYCRVAQKCSPDAIKMSFSAVIMNRSAWGIPAFETVRRTRQKLQREFPELRSDSLIMSYRSNNEAVYNQFATEI